MISSKLSQKNVLVTGADGFIGSNLSEFLLPRCKKVRALAQYNSFNSWGWLDHSPQREEIEILTGDIRDPHFCRELLEGIDIVFHLAALIAIPYSYIAPASYVDTNISGTLNLVQGSLEKGVEHFIQTSTSEVYGTARYTPIDESHPLQPQSPYSASKIAADAMAMSYFNSFETPITIARPFNTYGPRQSARAIIPTIITRFANGHKELQLGNLTPRRNFNFVFDTCQGFFEIASNLDCIGKSINIGSEKAISMGELVELIAKLMKVEDYSIQTDHQRLRPEGSEVDLLSCNGDLLKELTGYQPNPPLSEGLEKTIRWFREPDNLKSYKEDIYNV